MGSERVTGSVIFSFLCSVISLAFHKPSSTSSPMDYRKKEFGSTSSRFITFSTQTFPQHSFHLHSAANSLSYQTILSLHLHSFWEGNSAKSISKSNRDDNMDRGDIVVQYSCTLHTIR
ncbi:MAG: hypothetical protein JOS17DRAFT_739183 [Linnemannia elongata]|nr:MAG: hypothetical protein JOS17DRAFT_739183 [Linnemannia elongata]